MIIVLGKSASTAFAISAEAYEVDATLNPDEALALGDAMMRCCNSAPSACPVLKATFPGVYNGLGGTQYPDDNVPNFCHKHGNVCTK